MKAAIFTLSMGRERYLMDLMDSLMGSDPRLFQHFVMFQGTPPSEQLCYFFGKLMELGYPINFTNAPENLGSGLGLEKMKETFFSDKEDGQPRYSPDEFDTAIKMDDDCVVRSPDFMDHVIQVRKLVPDAVFSPYPVGLINNPGGVSKNGNHIVLYGKDTDTWYTFRPVHHIGGLCRVSSMHKFMSFKWPDDRQVGRSGREDGAFCTDQTSQNVQLLYMENAIIVEHNESTIGQHRRYGKEYFGNEA